MDPHSLLHEAIPSPSSDVVVFAVAFTACSTSQSLAASGIVTSDLSRRGSNDRVLWAAISSCRTAYNACPFATVIHRYEGGGGLSSIKLNGGYFLRCLRTTTSPRGEGLVIPLPPTSLPPNALAPALADRRGEDRSKSGMLILCYIRHQLVPPPLLAPPLTFFYVINLLWSRDDKKGLRRESGGLHKIISKPNPSMMTYLPRCNC